MDKKFFGLWLPAKTVLVLLLVILVVGVYGFLTTKNEEEGGELIEEKKKENLSKFGEGRKITMYRSPTCGCCVTYGEELEKYGFEVETISVENMTEIKSKYKIPADKQSCHTSILGDYFIEGHVPVVAIRKLIESEIEVEGIGLPGMPSGTPGMPGPKRGSYDIYQLKDEVFREFIKI